MLGQFLTLVFSIEPLSKVDFGKRNFPETVQISNQNLDIIESHNSTSTIIRS